jgi:hypothetical protein
VLVKYKVLEYLRLSLGQKILGLPTFFIKSLTISPTTACLLFLFIAAAMSVHANFSAYVHEHLALPIVYQRLRWEAADGDAPRAHIYSGGIDRVFWNEHGSLVSVKEFFSDAHHAVDNCLWLKCRTTDTAPPEFFKSRADYQLIGITNGHSHQLETLTGFLRFAIVEMQKVYEKIASGELVMLQNTKNLSSVIENGRLYCPIHHAPDTRQSIFPIDITLAALLWGNQVVRLQKGFLRP